jgi:DNA polymerase III alpha subunit
MSNKQGRDAGNQRMARTQYEDVNNSYDTTIWSNDNHQDESHNINQNLLHSVSASSRDRSHNRDRNEDLSSLTDNSNLLRVHNIYMRQETEELNHHTRGNVKRLIKKIVWPDNKFTSIEVVRDQDPDEMSNWMNLILAELNQSQKTKAEKARFWITYGIPNILPQLNTLKCVVQVSIRASIHEGIST